MHRVVALPLLLIIGCATPIATKAVPPPAGAKRLDVDAVRADFDQLYATLRETHYDLYAHATKAEYDQRYDATRAELAPATPLAVALQFQRFVAFGKVAHARIDAASASFAEYFDGGGKIFPLMIRVVDGRAFVTENRSGLATVARGDELIAIDGAPIAAWLERTTRNISGDTPYLRNAQLESSFPIQLWFEIGSRERFAVTLRRDGAAFERVLPARARPELRAASAAQPPVLAIDSDERVARMLDAQIAYLRPGAFYNATAKDPYDNASFRTFIDDAFRSFLAANATTLLIDLRENPGGDNSFSDLMVRWIADQPFAFASAFRIKVSAQTIASNARRLTPTTAPTDVSAQLAAAYAAAKPGDVIDFPIEIVQPLPAPRFTGRVYVLVNRHSYSNAVSVASLLQDRHWATVLGEETSDLATTFGAMESFTLPRTGLEVKYPKALIVRPSGDRTARGVVPDIAIATPIVEPADDPVLQQARAIVGRHP